MLFGLERFEQHGQSLAQTHEVHLSRAGGPRFRARMVDNVRSLKGSLRLLDALSADGNHLNPAIEWLLDNANVLHEQMAGLHGRQVQRTFDALPVLANEPFEGLPRVYGVAWAWIAHADSALDEKLLRPYLRAYQQERVLQLSELWALPLTLRVLLLENLRRLAERLTQVLLARKAANDWIDLEGDVRRLDDMVSAWQHLGVHAAFVFQIDQREHELHGARGLAVRAWLVQHEAASAEFERGIHNEIAASQQSIRNAITALRQLDKINWTELFEHTSPTLLTLGDIACHRAELMLTRGQTERALQALAKNLKVPELGVAQQIRTLCAAGEHSPDARERAPQHWLQGEGLDTLRRQLGGRPVSTVRRWFSLSDPRHVHGGLFMVLNLLLSSALATGLWWAGRPWGASLWWWPLMWIVSAEAVTAVLHRLVSESVQPRPLPRLDLRAGLAPEQATLVVMPCMLTSPLGIDELVAQLEQHALSNRDPWARYALLSDWADSATEHAAPDSALLGHARQALQALNLRHAGAPFRLLHRARTWSDSEQRYMGWERKRGKIEQLIALLNARLDDHVESTSPFVSLGELSQLDIPIAHVITLDADTDMPPGVMHALVGVAQHPLNRPRFDPESGHLCGGHAILQPRLQAPLPTTPGLTWFHHLFGGQTGLDPYAAAASEAYQDLYGTGTFTGKGLLDVRACHRVLHKQLPEAQVLSHDLLEGALARSASVTDVVLIESNPDHPDVVASRVHRWTRGDWQLLPFMGRPGRFPQSLLTFWKMADNLRRSWVAPAGVLLLAGSAVGALPAWPVFWCVVAALSAGPLIGTLAALSPARDDIDLWIFFRHGLAGLGRTLANIVWNLLTLLDQAWLLVDAVARALWRQFVSRRQLLEWTTAAAAQAAAQRRLVPLVKVHARTSITAALTLLALAVAEHEGARSAPTWAYGLAFAWMATPWWIWLSVRHVPAARGQTLSEPQRQWLSAVEAQTWRFFETHVTAEHHHLPPDNVQFDPDTLVAGRTSPTNIGLYLMAVMVARQQGHVSGAQALDRLESTTRTLMSMPKHAGHLYNWYDTRTLAVLPPAYVSSVDSGNLCGHLLAVAQACRHWGRQPDPQALQDLQRRLQMVADQLEQLALAMDFGFLYDPRARLLHIGYRVDRQELDINHYDMLSSECRLTSLLAIAKGDVPAEHWGSLARSAFGWRGRVGTRSWSGSMFEYLMPSLVMDEPRGSLLAEAVQTAVRVQREAARSHRTPWGVSESGIAGKDQSLAYQYGPQGVADLAVRRTPSDEWVVAPYATLMALSELPVSAFRNLQWLEASGARGEFGFMEAIDYSPDRQVEGSRCQVVRSHMAHHQGMALLGIFQALTGAGARPWLMSHPLMRSVMPLLHERVPHEVLPLRRQQGAEPQRRLPSRPPSVQVAAKQPEPSLAMWVSNERLSALVHARGVSQLRFQGMAVTRWRDLQWAAGPGVALFSRVAGESDWLGDDEARPASASTRFQPDRVVMERQHPRYLMRTACWVAPDDDCFFMEVDLENPGNQEVVVELASYLEVALSDPLADLAHPAFSKMFVDARWRPSRHALLFQRKARQHGETQPCMAHFMVARPGVLGQTGAAVDRSDVLVPEGLAWRVRAPVQPRVMASGEGQGHASGIDLDRAVYTGQDPIASLGCHVRVPADAAVKLVFCVAVAAQPDTLDHLIDKYQGAQHTRRASNLSYTMASVRQHERQVDAESWEALLTLTGLVCSGHRHMRPVPPRMLHGEQPRLDRQLMWRFGLSGERPMVVVQILHEEGLPMLRTLKRALLHWNESGHPVDLVVLNAEAPSYWAPVTRAVQDMVRRYEDQIKAHIPEGRRGVMKVVLVHELNVHEQWTLDALATVRLQADGRGLGQQVQRLRRDVSQARAALHTETTRASRADVRRQLPLTAVPSVRFDRIHGACRFRTQPGVRPPRPWSNVLANPGFGTLVTHHGSSFSWAENSNLHQITPWANDPLRDTSAELLILQDMDTRQWWLLGRDGDAGKGVLVEQQPGLTRITQEVAHLTVELTWSVDAQQSVKQVQLKVTNASAFARRLRLIGVHRWCLGSPVRGHRTIHTEALPWRDASLGEGLLGQGSQPLLKATQLDHADGFGNSSVLVGWRNTLADANAEAFEWTCDLDELLQPDGGLCVPTRLGQRQGLVGLPGAVLACRVQVAPGKSVERQHLMVHGWNASQVLQRWEQAHAVAPSERVSQQLRAIHERTRHTHVQSPDDAFNAMVNHWLPYQVLVCRLWGRAGYYQAGGALGYRDQLQDAMSLVDSNPDILARQILVHAARQFVEGDVQHWWHPHNGAGVRTHFSDDLLWLPMAVLLYLRKTGDHSLLDQTCAFLEGGAVPPGREDLYEVPRVSAESGTVFEHLARALDRSLPVGAHGLALMGCGDWNDGMNRVGLGGQGESVWLSWFLAHLLRDMAPLAQGRGEVARAERWRHAAEQLQRHLDEQAWDGDWYRRAWFDDGTPLGSRDNAECRIDLIAQAWSVLSGLGDPLRARQAMDSAMRHLHDPVHRVTALLAPPLQHQQPSAGYIQAYPPGVRENGGQYSHAAVWAMMALAQLKDPVQMWAVYEGISPAHRQGDAQVALTYGLEPYAVAADVYVGQHQTGKGGWSWYTGSAGWLLRASVESVCGVVRQAEGLKLQPCLPLHWPACEVCVLKPSGEPLRVVLTRDMARSDGGRAVAADQVLKAQAGDFLTWHQLQHTRELRVQV
jgi:cyclic beta-1,2-glucan synthetase